jgi:hypothetical protein
VKFAPSSPDVSRRTNELTVVPNLIDDDTTAPDDGTATPFRYHVIFGDGLPPDELQVSWTTSPSRHGPPDELAFDVTVGVPGTTVMDKRL